MIAARVDRQRLIRAVPDGPFDSHARLVARMLSSDVALVTIIDADSGLQRFAGQHGLPAPLRESRQAPLRTSLCRRVAATDEPLVLNDLSVLRDPQRPGDVPDLSDAIEPRVMAYAGVPLRTPSGEAVGAVCAMSLDPRPWTGQDVARLLTIRDHLEQELPALLQTADQIERADEVSLVLSTLRHELGSELTVVLGGIETAQLPGIAPDIRERVLATAAREARRVIDTLDALLRIDQRAPIRRQVVDLAEVTRTAVANAGVAGATARVQVHGEPLEVRTEPTLVNRIISNLADNACKYSDGPVEVRVTTRSDGRPGITVTDVGDGLPAASLTQLFEPFTRTHAAADRGFGLGMFIVRMLTERLEAELSIASDDEGTTIGLWLPVTSLTQDARPA